jgi:hypothetical protein
VWPEVKEVHAASSELLVNIWGMPSDIALVLRLHHDPRSDGHIHPLAAAVRLADSFSETVGLGFMTDADPSGVQESAKQLGLSDAELSRLLQALTELAAKFGT